MYFISKYLTIFHQYSLSFTIIIFFITYLFQYLYNEKNYSKNKIIILLKFIFNHINLFNKFQFIN